MINGLRVENLKRAIEIFYTYEEISNRDISEIFGIDLSRKSKLYKVKRPVYEAMDSRGIVSKSPYFINTKIAYEIWGIDIADLEERYLELRKLEIVE